MSTFVASFKFTTFESFVILVLEKVPNVSMIKNCQILINSRRFSVELELKDASIYTFHPSGIWTQEGMLKLCMQVEKFIYFIRRSDGFVINADVIN